MKTDFRTKPATEWTYYVVDHLPTMNRLYRFDTVGEALAKFKELPKTAISAIGSSRNSIHEIDHIHRRNGEAVLVTDSDRMSTSLWRDSKEIQTAIDQMISELDVQYELSSDLFGTRFPSIAIPLERQERRSLDSYFEDKILYPSKPNRSLSAINEVFVQGEGWIPCEDFFNQLDHCRPKNDGKGAKTLFVDKLNIQYINQSGAIGQADINPLNFRFLKEKSERYVSFVSTKSMNSLSEVIQKADIRSKQSLENSQSHNNRMNVEELHR